MRNDTHYDIMNDFFRGVPLCSIMSRSNTGSGKKAKAPRNAKQVFFLLSGVATSASSPSPLSPLPPHVPGTSASAQWSKAAGGSLGKRVGKGLVHDDEVHLFDDEGGASPPSQSKRVEFVDEDDVEAPQDFDGTPTSSAPEARLRARKMFKTGVNQKDADLLIVHPKQHVFQQRRVLSS